MYSCYCKTLLMIRNTWIEVTPESNSKLKEQFSQFFITIFKWQSNKAQTICRPKFWYFSISENWTMIYHLYSALMSLGLLLHGILYLTIEDSDIDSCWRYKMIYGLYIVPIITSFLGIIHILRFKNTSSNFQFYLI